MTPGSLGWFAAHEARLAWRDWTSFSGGRLGWAVPSAIVALEVGLHLLAAFAVHPPTIFRPNVGALAAAATLLAMAFAMMFSQAMEQTARAIHGRGDMALILSSPSAIARPMGIRSCATSLAVFAMTLVLAAPVANVLALRGGTRWLAIYPALAAVALLATAAATVATVAMFDAFGPRRARLISQIVAAVAGASVAIGLQMGALIYLGSADRLAFLFSPELLSVLPSAEHFVWLPVRSIFGDPLGLATSIAMSVVALWAALRFAIPRFATQVLAASSDPGSRRLVAQSRCPPANGPLSPTDMLLRKEWQLLWRDPWLPSQTLMQTLYLLPAAYMIWLGSGGQIGMIFLAVPILVTSAGQLAGGLAWLAVSGEDAPDLIGTAPVSASAIFWAKFASVGIGTYGVFAPFLLVLYIYTPLAASASFFGIAAAIASSTTIQYWFRLPATGGKARRRQTASRLTTYAEALASVAWGAAAAMALARTPRVLLAIGGASLVLTIAWAMRPRPTPESGPSRSTRV